VISKTLRPYYDRIVSRRAVRLLLIPAILFAAVAVGVFALAQWHPAKRESKTPAVVSVLIDPIRGEQLFAENCATCHGEGGEGGGVGPRLVGNDVSIDQARATIENGSGVMPAGLVSGQDLEDVIAYLDDDVLAP
jgi:mono/diheme cytochrome c family protein